MDFIQRVNNFIIKGEYDSAIELYEQEKKLDPYNATIYNSIGELLRSQERYEEAIFNYKQLIKLNPEVALNYFFCGYCYVKLLNFDQAFKYYAKATQLDPNIPIAQIFVACTNLMKGNFQEGLKRYEYRYDILGISQEFRKKKWQGEDLTNKTINIFAEQGFGDTIQFCRFIKFLKSQNCNIVFYCFKELAELMKTCEGIDEIRIKTEYAVTEGDFNILLLSLPKILGLTFNTIPNQVPYLKTSKSALVKWEEKLKPFKKIKIGFVWESLVTAFNYEHRNVPLQYFYNLLNFGEITLFSLRKGETKQVLITNENIIDFNDEINDFNDTAAIIEKMDLIISIDTAIVHLAGALNKTAWVILDSRNDWRWFLERDDSPWYPSVRLFRRAETQTWDELFDIVYKELVVFCGCIKKL